MLDSVGLVHMNGRVYDPLTARFGSPDPMTESPFSTQGWNRYSYVGNSPLNFTDPSGYCFMGCFFSKAFSAIGKLFQKIPILGTLLQIAAGAICGPVCAVAASAFVSGVTSGKLGNALRAGLITALTAGAFSIVGDLTGNFDGVLDPSKGGHGPLEFGKDAHIFNVAGHAVVGCLSAAASGGKCGAGALSGAVGSFVTPLVESAFPNARSDLGERLAGAAVTGTAGGLGSIAGGGKFANGAATAAFGYLFNNSGAGQALGSLLGADLGVSIGAGAAALCTWFTGGACAPAIPWFTTGGTMAGRWAGSVAGGAIEDWLFNQGNQPPKIEGFVDHGWERMQEEQITWKEIQNDPGPWKQTPQRDGSTLWVGKSVTYVLNENNWLVTIWRTGTFR